MSILSRIGYDWAVRCFGLDHCKHLPLRSQRTLEESAELSQALGLSREDAHLTIDKVYDRPVGEAEQEIGGILHTVGILCESMHVDPDELHEREVRRVLTKSPEHFAKRNQEKLDLGLDASAQSSGDLPRTHCYSEKWCIGLNGSARCSDCPVGNGQPTIAERIVLDARQPGDDKAQKAYEHSCDNGPIHSNRMPTWAELGETEKNAWRAAVGSQDAPIPTAHEVANHGGRPLR